MQCIRNNEAIKEANVKGPDFFQHTQNLQIKNIKIHKKQEQGVHEKI